MIYIYIHSISSLYVPMVGLVPVKYPRCVYLSCSKLLYFLLWWRFMGHGSGPVTLGSKNIAAPSTNHQNDIYICIYIYIYTHTDTHISMILALVSEFTWCFPCFFHVFPAFIRHFSILLVGGKWFLFPLRSHPHGFRISVARCLRRPWDEGISTTFWLKPINVVIPLLTMYIYIYTHIFIYTHDICTYIYNI
jgi:hypothetical protein